jgi:hypothetical protein
LFPSFPFPTNQRCDLVHVSSQSSLPQLDGNAPDGSEGFSSRVISVQESFDDFPVIGSGSVGLLRVGKQKTTLELTTVDRQWLALDALDAPPKAIRAAEDGWIVILNARHGSENPRFDIFNDLDQLHSVVAESCECVQRTGEGNAEGGGGA